MDRYMLGFLIFVGWFVFFRMFPASFEQAAPPSAFFPTDSGQSYSSGGGGKGKLAFQTNCARCHNMVLEKKSTGPALLGVSSRIPGGDWIYRWIQNSGKMIQDGDAYALRIYKDNQNATMDSFPDLSRETIDDIMDWIDSYSLVMY